MTLQASGSGAERTPASPAGESTPPCGGKAGNSYAQTLTSTALVGGASAVNLAVGLVRTKAMALVLGPGSFGLMGMYIAIADLARSLAEMGINSSGVRQIAAAASSGDEGMIARTALVLRRTALVLGTAGALLLLLLSGPVSQITFGTERHGGAIALLGLAVFLRLVADSRSALLQGLRKIPDLAKSGIAGSLLGMMLSVPLILWLGEQGVVPALIAMAAASAVAAGWYSRKVRQSTPILEKGFAFQEASALLKLGVAFMVSTLLMMGTSYVVRLIVLRYAGTEAAGYYHAAWAISGLYVGFVLQAMGTDFYPRLVGVIQEPARANTLVNEQAQVSLLLAAPGVLATITFAPLLLPLLYSSEFAPAARLLQWITLGMALRVVTWPVGYIIVAANRRGLFMATESAWAVVNVALSWYCVRVFGLDGAGIAFFASYLFHWAVVYLAARHLIGFRWTAANLGAVCGFAALLGSAVLGLAWLPPGWGMGLGALLIGLSGLNSVRTLVHHLGLERIPAPLARLLVLFRLARRPASDVHTMPAAR